MPFLCLHMALLYLYVIGIHAIEEENNNSLGANRLAVLQECDSHSFDSVLQPGSDYILGWHCWEMLKAESRGGGGRYAPLAPCMTYRSPPLPAPVHWVCWPCVLGADTKWRTANSTMNCHTAGFLQNKHGVIRVGIGVNGLITWLRYARSDFMAQKIVDERINVIMMQNYDIIVMFRYVTSRTTGGPCKKWLLK